MNNPGPFTLGDFQVGAAATQIGTPVTGLAGMLAASLQVRLAGGAAGSAIRIFVVTSLDQGQSWFDAACILFNNTPGVEVFNLSALDKVTSPAAPGLHALADNTVFDGILGDQLRADVVSTGTYGAGTLVSVRGVAR